MQWRVLLHEDFAEELMDLPEDVQDNLAAVALMLQEFGPDLGRPHVDTLKGSSFSKMKELRFNADSGVWRVAFAFDTKRQAILLVAGDKSGINQKQFYKKLIKTADTRFAIWLEGLTKG